MAYLDTEPLGGRAASPTRDPIKPLRQDGLNRTLLFSDLPNYKNVLLLQGPVGPFFKQLAHYWSNRGAKVTKINFNSGDDLYYPAVTESVVQFKSRLEFWPQYLSNVLSERNIRAVFLFGDCRPIHRPARSICDLLGIDLYVLEEGYIRPHLFTLERNGVNFYSAITETPIKAIGSTYAAQQDVPIRMRFERSYWYMVRWATAYWFANALNPTNYPNYTHHRILNLAMGLRWTKSFFRYWLYRLVEKPSRAALLKGRPIKSDSRWFLLPLQVHDDSQMTVHSDFTSVEHVLETVIS